MIWYEERLVRALQQTRCTERRFPARRRPRLSASAGAARVALRPATVR